MEYKSSKTIDLPQFVKVINPTHKTGFVKFELNPNRAFMTGHLDKYDLEDNECFYQSVFGWGIIVDVNTFKVIKNEHDVLSGKTPIEITEDEYGSGVF